MFSAFVWLGVWYVGHWVRQRRSASAEQERRAEQDQRLAVAEERTRIARDLHDSAGHAINVILVQAGGARLQLDRDAGAARVALETIEVSRTRRWSRSTGPPPPCATIPARKATTSTTPSPDRAAYHILQEASSGCVSAPPCWAATCDAHVSVLHHHSGRRQSFVGDPDDPDASELAVGRSIGELEIRSSIGVTVVTALRRGEALPVPGPEFLIEGGDTLVVMGRPEAIRRADALLRG